MHSLEVHQIVEDIRNTVFTRNRIQKTVSINNLIPDHQFYTSDSGINILQFCNATEF